MNRQKRRTKTSLHASQSPETVLRKMVRQGHYSGVIPWSCPVPSFGDYASARIASIGLNPSSREFVDNGGCELDGAERRFHTLGSLGIARWSEATQAHLVSAWECCRAYFSRVPYDAWFGQLEYIIGEAGASYYDPQAITACHLDIIPYATWHKWGDLPRDVRAGLLQWCRPMLGTLVRNSPIKVLIMNGSSVVKFMEEMSGSSFGAAAVPEWDLRSGAGRVRGMAYRGTVEQLGGVKLDREVVALGYNHNIQSSFGVTREVRAAIRRWVGHVAREVVA